MKKRIQQRFEAYVARATSRQYKPQRKFIEQVLFGILRRRSPLLSEIGRALDEPSKLIHTEKRLSRNLSSDRIWDLAIEQDYVEVAAPYLRDPGFRTPTIAVDFTDIIKPKAKAMPCLARVHDGSASDGNTIGNGFNVVNVEAVGDRGRRLPLVSRLFSHKDPEFRSELEVTKSAILLARRHVPEQAIWVFDRGYEGHRYLQMFKEAAISFAVRLFVPRHVEERGHRQRQRNLYVDGARRRIAPVIDAVECSHRFRIRKFGPHAKRSWMVDVGWIPLVRLEHYTAGGNARGAGADAYSVVVARGIGQEPLVILTNVVVTSRSAAEEVVNAYMERWGVEEAHRYTKQAFDLENLRALTWPGLRRLVLFAMLAYGFLASLVHGDREHIESVAAEFKAFGPVPTYMFYRLLEGIGRLLRARGES